MISLFRQLGLKVIFLCRYNKLRQVISALVAEKTGTYNSETYTPEEGRRFEFPVEKIVQRVKRADKLDQDILTTLQGVDFMQVFYEDWLSNSRGFFTDVEEFLGVPRGPVEAAEMSVTTPEPLRELLTNFEDLSSALEENGCAHYLEH
jgi:LPS sulfotransferase NodH